MRMLFGVIWAAIATGNGVMGLYWLSQARWANAVVGIGFALLFGRWASEQFRARHDEGASHQAD